MPGRLSGETLLYPIIGDPITFVKWPQRLTATFEERKHNGICVPMQVPDGELESFRPVFTIDFLGPFTQPHRSLPRSSS